MYNPAKFFHRYTAFSKTHCLPPSDTWPAEWSTVFYKTYTRAERVVLPEPKMPQNVLLEDVLCKRASANTFEDSTEVEADNVSTLLRYSCGLIGDNNPQRNMMRPYPSAGARYPLEVYPVIQNSKDLAVGIYHYHVPTHQLEFVRPSPFVSEVTGSFSPNLSWIKDASTFFIVSAVFDRTMNKYEERGYRYLLEEVGALTQNMYLVATALNLPIVTFVGFEDHVINELLDFDGVEESVVALVAIGGN